MYLLCNRFLLHYTRDERFEKIEATPEELAEVFLRTPPKKPEDWDYMKGTRSDE